MPLASFGFLLPDDVRADIGFQEGLAPNSPAAGGTFSRKVPGAFFEVVANARCVLTTSAAVANRILILRAKDGDGNQIGKVAAPAVQAASLAVSYNWSLAIGAAYVVATDTMMMPAFPFVMPSGWTLQIDIVNVQAADQMSQIGLVLQQYATGLETEEIRPVQPLDLSGLGIVTATPISTPTPSAAPLPSAAPATAPAASPARTATPAQTPTPSFQELADAAALGGPNIRE